MKRPSFQFYPGDWLRDTALRSCSISARGLWTDMLCLMHQGSPYGYLKVGDKVILPDTLARMVGVNFREIKSYLIELEQAGVYSRDEGGCIYSRRMVKDEQTRIKRASGGILGGNPALKKDTDKVHSKVNLDANLKPTPSSSSSSSSSVLEKIDPLSPDIGEKNYMDEARERNQRMAIGSIRHFGRFRELYPKPGNWLEAEISWRQKNCDAQAEKIFVDVPKRKAEDAYWQEARFIPNPENYLKREVWKNAIVPKSTEKSDGNICSGKPIAQLRAERDARERAARQSVDRPGAGEVASNLSDLAH